MFMEYWLNTAWPGTVRQIRRKFTYRVQLCLYVDFHFLVIFQLSVEYHTLGNFPLELDLAEKKDPNNFCQIVVVKMAKLLWEIIFSSMAIILVTFMLRRKSLWQKYKQMGYLYFVHIFSSFEIDFEIFENHLE